MAEHAGEGACSADGLRGFAKQPAIVSGHGGGFCGCAADTTWPIADQSSSDFGRNDGTAELLCDARRAAGGGVVARAAAGCCGCRSQAKGLAETFCGWRAGVSTPFVQRTAEAL